MINIAGRYVAEHSRHLTQTFYTFASGGDFAHKVNVPSFSCKKQEQGHK